MWPVIARKRFCSFNKALLRYGRRDLTWWIVQVERALKHLRAVCYVKPRVKALLTSPWAICPSKHLAQGPSDVGLPAPWLTYGQYRDWRTRPN